MHVLPVHDNPVADSDPLPLAIEAVKTNVLILNVAETVLRS